MVFNFQLQLYARLVATVDSEHFLARLKSLQQASVNGISYEFPFKEATGFLVYFMGLKTSMPHPIYTISNTDDAGNNTTSESHVPRTSQMAPAQRKGIT